MTKQLYLHNPPQPVEAIVVKGKQWVHCHSTTQHHNLYNVFMPKENQTKQKSSLQKSRKQNRTTNKSKPRHQTKERKQTFFKSRKRKRRASDKHESPAQIKT